MVRFWVDLAIWKVKPRLFPCAQGCPMSHHVPSCPIMSHHVPSCPIMSHHVPSCPIMSHHVPSCPIMSHPIIGLQNCGSKAIRASFPASAFLGAALPPLLARWQNLHLALGFFAGCLGNGTWKRATKQNPFPYFCRGLSTESYSWCHLDNILLLYCRFLYKYWLLYVHVEYMNI